MQPATAGNALRPARAMFDLSWVRGVTSAERRTLFAGGLGWMLDAFDVSLYSLVLTHLMRDFGMSPALGGLLNSLTLVASAFGGFLFGLLADRIGRTRSLMATILIYSAASGACGLSANRAAVGDFSVHPRTRHGRRMDHRRGADRRNLASRTSRKSPRPDAIVLRNRRNDRGGRRGFRAASVRLANCFLRGDYACAFDLLDSEARSRAGDLEGEGSRGRVHVGRSLRVLWRKDLRRQGALATAMNACAMFGYWGLFTWIPAYLSLPVAQGGRGLSLVKTTGWLIVMGVGKFLGYTSFGFAADTFGRRKSYVTYLLVATALVPIYGFASSPALLLFLGPFVAFFGTGHFSGFAAIVSEIFPTEIRATAMGASYNIGRGTSAAAPFVIGLLAHYFGLGPSFLLLAGAFLVAGMLALALPETRGKQLE